MHGLQLSQVQLDRKALADVAVNDPDTFTKLVDLARSQLPAPAPAA